VRRSVLSADTVVFGGGVAGLAVSIALARRGQRVVVIERDTGRRPYLGENLSSAAKPILVELGLWDRFLADGHLPCYAAKSAWGGPEIAVYDFLNNPHGHAWRIDRPMFERLLTETALALGISRLSWQRPNALYRAGDGWYIEIPQIAAIRTGFLVDATGRAASVARRHGARRLALDRQVAVVGLLATSAIPLSDPSILVESAPDGWWYSAVLPDGQLVVALVTDPDVNSLQALSEGQGWLAMLAASRHTRARITEYDYRLISLPQVVAAGSGHLDRVGGAAWLAVGDAAMAFDPLSAHGLVVALASARDAAAAILSHQAGDTYAISSYDAQLALEFAVYNARRRALYGAEPRWRSRPYWRRRQ
jgi:flavin-dependent dehydrogenase